MYEYAYGDGQRARAGPVRGLASYRYTTPSPGPEYVFVYEVRAAGGRSLCASSSSDRMYRPAYGAAGALAGALSFAFAARRRFARSSWDSVAHSRFSAR